MAGYLYHRYQVPGTALVHLLLLSYRRERNSSCLRTTLLVSFCGATLPFQTTAMLVVYRNKSSLYCYFLLLLLGSILESSSSSSVAAEVAEQTCSADGTCTTTATSSSAASSSCVDVESACGYWADVGECDINPGCT